MKVIAICLVVILTSASAFSLVVPGKWEKVSNLSRGEPLIVILRTGDRVAGRFHELTETALVLERESKEERRFPRDAVVTVLAAQPVEDSTLNGKLIGAAAGFGLGFLAAVIWEKSVTASGYRLAEENLTLALLAGGAGAGLGVLTGWAIDRSRTEHEVLYRAVPP